MSEAHTTPGANYRLFRAEEKLFWKRLNFEGWERIQRRGGAQLEQAREEYDEAWARVWWLRQEHENFWWSVLRMGGAGLYGACAVLPWIIVWVCL